ncbi:MAG: caspase family protein, partial [candidate division KSB1 bacterium]|nr:caspase family protein [candidate division KSB1 bacterium]
MANSKRSTANFYALLIGIDCYLPNRLPEGRYPNLGGCVSDITKVEKFLQNALKLPAENIFKLTATDIGKREPAEPEAQWPTYE